MRTFIFGIIMLVVGTVFYVIESLKEIAPIFIGFGIGLAVSDLGTKKKVEDK